MSDARIEYDYIEIDTDAWIAARSGGPVDELTDLYDEFDSELRQRTTLTRTIDLFITARAGSDWRTADHAIITSADGGGPVNLSDDVIIYRYTDPEHSDIAFIATDDHGFTGQFTAHADNLHDPADWYDFHHVELACPDGHGWSLRSDELIDSDGNTQPLRDHFPDGQVVTTNDDPDSPTTGQSQVRCPTCGQPCTLDLPYEG